MKCQNLFSEWYKKYIINLSSTELAQIVVQVKIYQLKLLFQSYHSIQVPSLLTLLVLK